MAQIGSYFGRTARQVVRHRWLHIMLLPGIVYFIVFKYIPMWGIVIAFKNYQPFLGFWESEWVGLKYFKEFFSEPTFWILLRNTGVLALYSILFYFPVPIILALLLNEVRKEALKRFIQTSIYLPHFMSWVIVVSIFFIFLKRDEGILNNFISSLGGERLNFLISTDWFRTVVTVQSIWKEAGWGTILFLAALAGIDPQMYEAARIDGANRWQQLWRITLPCISSTIVILLVLRLGNFLELNFEQMYLMGNAMNRDVADVFDTYVYRMGIQGGRFSYSATVGIFSSTVGLILILASNYIARKTRGEGLF